MLDLSYKHEGGLPRAQATSPSLNVNANHDQHGKLMLMAGLGSKQEIVNLSISGSRANCRPAAGLTLPRASRLPTT
jgi:hypothetical protein